MIFYLLQVNQGESLVGWFATGNEITSHSALIHDYYARETKDPTHLTVDTTLNSGKVCFNLGRLMMCKLAKCKLTGCIE